MKTATRISRAMSGDELGLRTARYGPVVLRSAFHLYYRPDGEMLRAAMVRGEVRPMLEGRQLNFSTWLADQEDDERDFVSCLGAALHLANHAHIGVADLDHMVVVRDGSGMCFAEVLAPLMQEAGVEPARLVGTIRDPSCFTEAQLSSFAVRFRALGGRVAVGMGGQHSLQAIRATTPEFVVVDGAWFAQVSRNAMAMRLLRSLVSAFRSGGAKVVIEGVETRGQLAAALNVAADLVGGPLLCPAVPVGRDTPPETIPLGNLLADGARIIPMFANGQGTHQPG